MSVICRDQDHGGVSGHGEAHKEIQAPGEFSGGGDGDGLSVHHSALHPEAEFQRAGQQPPEITSSHTVCTSECTKLTRAPPPVGAQHPGEEGGG